MNQAVKPIYLNLQEDLNFKVIVLGSEFVGKTSLIYRIHNNSFNAHQYTPTLGCDYIKYTKEIDKKKITLNIWDTAGQERFRTISRTYFKDSHAALIIYDITNAESFKTVEFWIKELSEYGSEFILKYIVGNKNDLDHSRKVEKYDAQKLSDLNMAEFFECSAKTGDEIDELINCLIENLYTSFTKNKNFREIGLHSFYKATDLRKSIEPNHGKSKSKGNHKSSCC